MSGRNVVTLQGTLLAGPAKGSSAGFPTGLVNAEFTLRPSSKGAAVSVYDVRNLSSPSGFLTLRGVGAGETVTQATTLYLRTESPMQVRLTYDDGSGGSRTATLDVEGLCILEAPSTKFIKLLEASGVGVVEYFASGNQ